MSNEHKSGGIWSSLGSITDLFDRKPVQEPAPPAQGGQALQMTSVTVCAPGDELAKIAERHRAEGHKVTGASDQPGVSSDCIRIDFKP